MAKKPKRMAVSQFDEQFARLNAGQKPITKPDPLDYRGIYEQIPTNRFKKALKRARQKHGLVTTVVPLQPRTYNLLMRCVEDGIGFGLNRIFKHVETRRDTPEDRQAMTEALLHAISHELDCWFEFE